MESDSTLSVSSSSDISDIWLDESRIASLLDPLSLAEPGIDDDDMDYVMSPARTVRSGRQKMTSGRKSLSKDVRNRIKALQLAMEEVMVKLLSANRTVDSCVSRLFNLQNTNNSSAVDVSLHDAPACSSETIDSDLLAPSVTLSPSANSTKILELSRSQYVALTRDERSEFVYFCLDIETTGPQKKCDEV